MDNDYLIKKPPLQALFLFALPMIIGNLFQQTYTMVDSAIVGRYVSEQALAAVGASYALTNIFICVAIGGGIGASVIVSRYFGAKEYGRMKTAVFTALLSFLGISLVLGVAGLFLGNQIMIAPVYEQNARGRYVYLPEEMKFIKFLPDGSISEEVLAKGIHYVDVALNEVPLFIRSGKCIPVAEAAECVKDIDTEHLQLIGYKNSSYTMYEDDGIHKDYDKEENYRVFTN
mgnify:CR=1 FL=1